jgi:hypothetical protein
MVGYGRVLSTFYLVFRGIYLPWSIIYYTYLINVQLVTVLLSIISTISSPLLYDMLKPVRTITVYISEIFRNMSCHVEAIFAKNLRE